MDDRFVEQASWTSWILKGRTGLAGATAGSNRSGHMIGEPRTWIIAGDSINLENNRDIRAPQTFDMARLADFGANIVYHLTPSILSIVPVNPGGWIGVLI